MLACTLSIFSTNAQTWTAKQSYPLTAGADGSICFSIGNKIYAGGGMNSKSFYEYDPSSNAWAAKADIPGVADSRAFAISFSVNGKGYVALGIDGTTLKNDLWQYDTTANMWTQKANFPGSARDGLFSFVLNNKFYCGAGEDPFSLQQYNKCYVYDPATNVWDTIASLPTSGLIYPFSFAIGGKGYVSCGADTAETTATYEYNPTSNTWVLKASFTGPKRQAGVSFVLNNIAYCGLGMAAGFYNDFYAFDPSANSWHPSVTFPSNARSFPVAVTVGDVAYAGLGWSFTSSTNLFLDWYKFAFPTAIETVTEQSVLTVFPNPATDQLNIISDERLQSIELTDISGKIIVAEKNVRNNSYSINTTAFAPGTYFLKATCADKAQIQKVQIDH